MLKHRRPFIIFTGGLLLCFSLFAIYSFFHGVKAWVDPNKPLSVARREQFIKEHKIQPLLIAELDQRETVIMYRTPDDMGYYVTWSSIDDDDNIGFKWVSTEDWAPDQAPSKVQVSVLRDSTSNIYRTTQFVALTINDEALLQQATTIKVLFSTGTEVTAMVNGQPAHLLSAAEGNSQPGSHQEVVVLYDAAANEIFRQPLS